MALLQSRKAYGMFRSAVLIGFGLVLTGCATLDEITDGAPVSLSESRGVWLDKAQMLEGRERLPARLDRLQEAGFNTI